MFHWESEIDGQTSREVDNLNSCSRRDEETQSTEQFLNLVLHTYQGPEQFKMIRT